MKKTLLTVFILAAIAGISYVSAALGYLMGGPQYAARFASTDAFYTVTVLQKLREGNSEAAIELLESQLDNIIVEHSTFDPNVADWLDLLSPIPDANSASDKLMTIVAKYRVNHPSSEMDSEVGKHIDNHLDTYLK